MKEIPILFKSPMVCALLAGTKTQTRRVVTPQPVAGQGMVNAAYCGHRNLWLRDGPCDKSDPAKEWRAPYGQPGDRLWVRETYWRDDEDGAILYAANPDDFEIVRDNKIATGSPRYNWKPSIFMPRWASRIMLEVIGVRVERLQDISEADAQAEGIERLDPPPAPHEWSGPNRFTLSGMGSGVCAGQVSWNAPTAIELYRRLWESINGPGSWDENPWVWAIEFKRVTPCP